MVQGLLLMLSPLSLSGLIGHQLKVILMNRKIVSADGDSLGPIGEVHIKFQLGKVSFHNRFIILDNLK